MRNHRKKPQIEDKENATLEEIKKLRKLFICEGRRPTKGEAETLQTLRRRLNNYTEIKRVWLSEK